MPQGLSDAVSAPQCDRAAMPGRCNAATRRHDGPSLHGAAVATTRRFCVAPMQHRKTTRLWRTTRPYARKLPHGKATGQSRTAAYPRLQPQHAEAPCHMHHMRHVMRAKTTFGM